MKFIRTTPSLNGKYEEAPQPRGGAAVASQRTAFPEDPPRRSIRTWLYAVSRYQWGSASLFRWLLFLLIASGAVWIVGWLPGHWLVAGGAVVALMALLLLSRYWRRRDFVHFVPGTPPVLHPQPLPPPEKVPVMVTGLFGVEQKMQRFTWLPGFYRTFATREHALLCQVTQQRWAMVGRWPEDEVGLWYIFFAPTTILQIEWGELYFGVEPRQAIAVTHRVTMPKQKRWRSEQVREETVYLAFTMPGVGELIWADLHHDFPQPAKKFL